MKKKSKNNINEQGLKSYDLWNKARYTNREDKDNLCPIGLTNEEFIRWIKTVFLGEDWYTVMPLSTTQINEELLEEIIYKVTGELWSRRDKEYAKIKK